MTAPLQAGWFPDQMDPLSERWYDGQAWTTTTRPRAGAFPFASSNQIAYGGAGSAIEAPLPPAPQDLPPSVPPRSRRRLAFVGAGALALVIAGGVTFGVMQASSHNETITVHGVFVLTDSQTADAHCIGQGGYSDISPGVSVIVTNQDNKILGSSSLGAGNADSGAGTCTYSFSIDGISPSEEQYAVEVSHRGKVVNSKAELAASGWSFGLSMGS